MSYKSKLISALAVASIGLVAIFAADQAGAAILPPGDAAVITGSVFSGPVVHSVGATGHYEANSFVGLSKANVSLNFPSISVSADGIGNSANVTITYDLMVTGPTPSVLLLVDASGSATSSKNCPTGGCVLGVANFAVSNIITDRSAVAGAGGSAPLSGTFSVAGDFSFQTNTLYTVKLMAMALSTTGGVATASVDPSFQIDSLFADRALYDVELSPGVGNGIAATPIPAVGLPGMAFVITGGGLIAWRRRRRKVT
jgi:hypothetical protein